MGPPEFFYARLTISWIVLKFSIAFVASFVQLLVEKIDRVMLGHGAMTSQREQGQAIFAENGGLLHINPRPAGALDFHALLGVCV